MPPRVPSDAQTAAADRPRPPFSAKPPILPIDVCGLEGEPACALRAWDVHLGGAALPAAVGKYTLVHIDGRDAHGAVLESNHYHSSFDGIRWKSSNGAVRNSRLGVRYLEVTPLQHYLEGELQIDNVTIEGNTFLCEAGGACMQDFDNGGKGEGGFCTGYLGPGSTEYWSGACTNIALRNNSYQRKPPAVLEAAVAPGR